MLISTVRCGLAQDFLFFLTTVGCGDAGLGLPTASWITAGFKALCTDTIAFAVIRLPATIQICGDAHNSSSSNDFQ